MRPIQLRDISALADHTITIQHLRQLSHPTNTFVPRYFGMSELPTCFHYAYLIFPKKHIYFKFFQNYNQVLTNFACTQI